MAEAKNNFLASKMNKDVDARIIPNGEYRNALNLQINKSEGFNVGNLQTSLGNKLSLDFRDSTKNFNLQCIGTFTDEKSNIIIFFLTDYNQQGAFPSYKTDAENFIFMYNTQTGQTNVLVEGAFLNFSITNPIIGVNLLEDLLFWTDNRNQPRKINIVTAQQQPDYYYSEEQISVAKINPYTPIEMYKDIESIDIEIPYETTMYDVVSEFLPFNGCAAKPISTSSSSIIVLDPNSYRSTVLPSSIGGISDATAVRPQVGQLVANSDGVIIPGVKVDAFPYTSPNTVRLNLPISYVAGQELKFNPNPYYDPDYIGDTNYLEDKFVKFSYRFKFDDGEYSIFAPFTQTAFIPKQDGYFGRKKNPLEPVSNGFKRVDGNQGTATESAGSVIKLISNVIVPLPGQVVKCSGVLNVGTYVVEWNPPYLTMSQAAIPGIITGYSTQFEFETNPPKWIEDNQAATYKSTIVDFMQNKVNKILLRLRLPCNGDELRSKYNITEVDILYSEASSLPVSVIDTIPVEKIAIVSEGIDIYEYTYDSKKPFKTLPQDQLIRVYDKVPLKALSQEIISNRVVYGNYQDKATYPKYLDYNVKYSEKSVFNPSLNIGENRTSIIEYPNHSLKQNRTYQVGIVLADLFGRQSGVILSSATVGVENYIAASLFVPYRTLKEVGTAGDAGNALYFPGYSLKVLFNSIIPNEIPNPTTGWPGLYNGDKESPNYNPLGWYSYKIVVKQTEQDYYNVYLPGVLAGYPVQPFEREIGNTSHIVLLNDNINKVPRDLQQVGPVQLQFRSSVRLYGRVENILVYDTIGPDPTANLNSNAQYFPTNTFLFADTIATTDSLFSTTPTTPTYPFQAFYEINSNPLIARLSTPDQFGLGTWSAPTAINTAEKVISLSVLETQGDESLLDIYWETSTTGLISELNEAILTGTSTAVNIEGFALELEEYMSNDEICSTRFAFKDVSGTIITNVFVDSLYVDNLIGTPRSSDFVLETILAGDTPPVGIGGGVLTYNTFYLKTNTYFYYGPNSEVEDSFRFTFNTNVGGITNPVATIGALVNNSPEIINVGTGPEYFPSGDTIHRFDGLNGSNIDGGKSEFDQLWTIVLALDENGNNATNQFVVSNSLINDTVLPKRGLVSFAYGNPGGEFRYTILLRLTDAGGLTDEYNMIVENPT